MAGAQPQLEKSWFSLLSKEFEQSYMLELREFLRNQKRQGKIIYPPGQEMFAALNQTPVSKVKVVIIGQDPYHGPGQAHGLCFSVKAETRIPPSLVNIFQEINSDLEPSPQQQLGKERGNLSEWAAQGVLLLNAVLSVEQGQAASHQGKGWEQFTDAVVRELCQARTGLVFILWGAYAQKKGAVVDPQKNLIIRSPHPSPLSAHRGFFGSRPFSQANSYLQSQGQTPIDWLRVV